MNIERPSESWSDYQLIDSGGFEKLEPLAARAAGADVTHLDSVRQVVTWARHNMEISSLDGIRWTIDDALKYVTRQVHRGASFDGIILDPPAYGRGPDGERWKLDEYLNDILKGCAQILAPMNSFLVLNLYSNGYSAMLADTLVACAFGSAGRRTSGELVLRAPQRLHPPGAVAVVGLWVFS